MEVSRAPGAVNRWLFTVVERVRTSLWAVPLVTTIGAVVAARLAVWVDGRVDYDDTALGSWLYGGGASNAQTVLSALAASLITVAGTAFSITVVVLSFASSQLGPRLLRTFMRDSRTQTVLGVFLATFAYQIVVLASIRGGADTDPVPRLAASGGIVLAALSFGALVFFIHHVATSISADVVIGRVHSSLEGSVGRLFAPRDAPSEDDGSDRERPEESELEHAAVARHTGYVQAVDYDRLCEVAEHHDVLLRLESRPGQFVSEGTTLFRASRPLEEDEARALERCLVLGSNRTGTQDVEYWVRQLVEVALRALSPGLNDPFTAISCIDHLGAALVLLADREMPGTVRYERDGRVRVVVSGVTFEGAMDVAWNQIRQSSASHPAVLLRMLEALTSVAERLARLEGDDVRRRRECVREHGALVRDAGDETCAKDPERRELRERHERLQHTLERA